MTRFVLLLILIGGVMILFLAPVGIVQGAFRGDIIAADAVRDVPVALVLGASVYAGKPSQVLQDRLDVAHDLYEGGKIKKIIVSGDDRAIDYNEPTAMQNYLVEQGVKKEDVVPDFAGRRTYDSCFRAKEIFDQDRVVIISQELHLPRALYLCKTLGIDAVGVGADRSGYANDVSNIAHEIAGSWLAWWDVNVGHPQPIMGEKEKVF